MVITKIWREQGWIWILDLSIPSFHLCHTCCLIPTSLLSRKGLVTLFLEGVGWLWWGGRCTPLSSIPFPLFCDLQMILSCGTTFFTWQKKIQWPASLIKISGRSKLTDYSRYSMCFRAETWSQRGARVWWAGAQRPVVNYHGPPLLTHRSRY